MNNKITSFRGIQHRLCLLLTFLLLCSAKDSQSKTANVPICTRPSITSFWPASGVIGTSVTIMGNSFNATAYPNNVFFGAAKATVTVASTSSLTLTVSTDGTYRSSSNI